MEARALDLLDAAIAHKRGGAQRPGQTRMVQAVEEAITNGTHLLIEAGPGTGKSFGYLIPLIAAKRRAVISTATKSLQDQLAARDLPFLAEALRPLGYDVTWSAVKGRSNYLCMSRVAEMASSGQTSLLESAVEDTQRVIEWAMQSPSGDRDDMSGAVGDELWDQLSVSGTECPGREACPQAAGCFAMAALDAAAEADLVVVNHHLYGAHLMANHSILPEHDVVVFDEGHRVADTMATSFGLDLSAARVYQLRRAAGFLASAVAGGAASRLIDRLASRARALAAALGEHPVGRLAELGNSRLSEALTNTAIDATEAARLARGVPAEGSFGGPRARLLRLAGHLVADVELVGDPPAGYVTWLERTGTYEAVRAAPIDVGRQFTDEVLERVTTVVTSATLSAGGIMRPIANQLGLRWQTAVDGVPDAATTPPVGADDADVLSYRSVRVDSPFDYDEQARLYVATDLPDPRADGWADAAVARVRSLVAASGGRALVLSTSHRMVGAFAEALRAEAPFEVLAQNDLPKRRLVEQFEADETSVLVATLGFWEGIDVPGRALQLVVLDKVPFPRPDDPLWQARRQSAEASGLNPFQTVDLPRAAILLAQGAGRLIRSVEDRGVVAVLDSRLATKAYGRTLIASLPPMPGTTDLDQIEAFLQRL